MATPVNVLYEFGPYQLDPPERLLLCEGQPISLTPKAFDLLLVLVDRSGHLVEKEELLRAVWRGAFVEEGNLAVSISQLRKALNDDRGHHRYIETVSKKGYRFVADVKRLGEDEVEISTPASAPENPLPPIELSRAIAIPASARIRLIPKLALAATVVISVAAIAMVIGHRGAAPSPIPIPPAIHSLAVMPFQTLSADSSDKYLGLGMADAVITKLANTRKIVVRPTSAIQHYAGTSLTPQAVGREQGVDAVLDGRIQREGDRVRVTIQLIRVQDGVQLWADAFERRFSDVFALEDTLSELAAQSIRLQLSGEETRKFTKRSTENPDAYEAFMKGRYFWNKRTDSGLKKGLEYFHEAIKLDPGFSEAYVGIADSYATLGLYSVLPPKQTFPVAKEAGMRALQMDDSLAAAHANLGFIDFYYEWNASASQDEFRRALAENPDYAMAHSWYAECLAATGQYPSAVSEAEHAIEDDPLSLIVGSNAGWTFALAGQYDHAVDTLKKTIEIDPNFPRTHLRLGQVYEQHDEYVKAIPEFEKAVQLSGGDPYYEGSLGHAYGASGNAERAREIIRDLETRIRKQYVPPYAIALVYSGLGDKEQAFQWLQRAVEDRSTSLVFFRSDPQVATLRSDPRFARISSIVNF